MLFSAASRLQSISKLKAIVRTIEAYLYSDVAGAILVASVLGISVGSSAPAQTMPPVGELSDPVTNRLLESEGANRLLSELELNSLPQPLKPFPLLDLELLILLPNTETIAWLDRQFAAAVAPINARIEFRQDLLLQLLSEPNTSDHQIRQAQLILSQLRAERDRMAIEHLLLVRQLSDDGKLPRPSEQPLVRLD